MQLTKKTTQGLGVVILVAVFAASGLLVIKPQIDNAVSLQDNTSMVTDATAVRQARLVKLKTENANIDKLTNNVNDLLLRIPDSKNVTEIAGAVVNAMPPGVYLDSFSHGPLDPKMPKFTTPLVDLKPLEPPIVLTIVKPLTSGPTKVIVPVIPPLAGAPFILTVRASSFEALSNFIDVMQNQKRLLTVTALTSTSIKGDIQATIYAYAFASSSPQIIKWSATNKK